MYSIHLEPDDNGTVLVTCPDLPEVTTFGEDEKDAVRRGGDAIEEALAARIARDEGVPPPAMRPNDRVAALPPLTVAKVELYRAVHDAGMSKTELARRLGHHVAKIDRLFDLRHGSKLEQIDQALRAIGKCLVVGVRDAA